MTQPLSPQKQLEQQHQEALSRWQQYVQFATQISQEMALIVREQQLYRRVVTLIKEHFDYYNAQLFRYDASKQTLVLVAGYGEPGEQMLAANYRVALEEGLIGAAATSGAPVLQSNLTQGQKWQPNPFLPETKSELAVPIKSGREDGAAQAAALQYFIEQGFDGLIVSVINPTLVNPVARQALRQNIPVVSFTSALEAGNQTTHLGIVEYELGKTLGLQAGAWAKNHISASQCLKVGILGYRSLPQLNEREAGMIAGIKQVFDGQMEVVASETAGDVIQGLSVAERWLATLPDLNMILGINDAGALGAYQAVQEAGKDDPDTFFVGGIDAIEKALAAIKLGGAYQATVDINPQKAGIQAVRCVVCAIKGLPFPKVIEFEPSPVDKNNLNSYLQLQKELPVAAWQTQTMDLTGLDLSDIKIGLSIVAWTNPFFVTLGNAVREEAERLGVELVINEPKQILGVLAVQSNVAGVLNTDDLLAMEGLAGQLAVAIEKTRLFEEANIFRQFAEAAGQGMGFATLEGHIVYLNPAFCQILNETMAEVVGKPFSRYFPAEAALRLSNEIIPAVLNQGHWSGELALCSSKGQVTPAIQNYSLLRDHNDNPQYLACVATDISDRKRAEEELQNAQERLIRQEKLAFIGQLAAGVGHELRNPLGVISNAVYLLQMILTEPDDKVKEYLALIASRVQEAERIVSDLLNLSRSRTAQPAKTDVSMLVTEALERYPLPETIILISNISPDLPLVYVDAQQIRQVLLNLIINACQAMPEGGNLTIKAEAEGERVKVSVADTGLGISPETTKKIFEPLFTTKTKGVGLGLAISRKFVEMNKGHIHVTSIEGKGSTFTIILPAVT